MKPKIEIENRNRNPKPVSETEIETEIESETETGTEAETEIIIPSGEELLDTEKVNALIGRIIDAAQDVGANLLEARQASKAVYAAANARIAANMKARAAEAGEDGGKEG